MKTIKIAIANNKGGIGKTSTTLGIVSGIRQLQPDAKILIVDSDEQSCIKTSFSVKLSQAEGGLAAVLMDGVQPENLAIQVRPNLDVILSGGRLMREFEKNYQKTPNADFIISECFKNVTRYDYIFFDTPPAFSLLTSNILLYCNYLIIPCTLDLFGYMGMKNTVSFMHTLKEHFSGKNWPLAKILGVVPTMFDQRRNMDLDTLQDLDNYINVKREIPDEGARVFEPIRQDMKVKSSQVKRKLLHEFAPTSKAADDYLTLSKAILKMLDIQGSETSPDSGKIHRVNQKLNTPTSEASL